LNKQGNKNSNLVPTSDVVFKNLFSKKGNEVMLKEFIEEITKLKIHNIEVIKEVELSQMSTEEKYGKLDLRAIINKNAIVVIEMQNNDNCNMEKRMTYYAGKVVGSSLAVGENYEQIKDVYVISILNYEMSELNKYMIETVTVDTDFRNYEVIEGLKFYFIELPKFRKKTNKLETKLQQWLAFIDYKRKDLIAMAIAKNKLIEKANQDYEYLTGDEATRRLQELREKAMLDENSAYATGVKRGEARGIEKGEKRGLKKGEAKGLKIGQQKGEKIGKMQTALEMLKDNLSIETIMKYTGLSSSAIEKLMKKV